MTNEHDWNPSDTRPHWSSVLDSRAVRFALAFGVLGVALAVVAAPMLESRTVRDYAVSPYAGEFDYTATGTVRRGGEYVERRSVLQQSPNDVCIIRPNGARAGQC